MNAFQQLFQKNKIHTNDTFYIVDTLHQTKWATNVQHILRELGVSQIFLVHSQENIQELRESLGQSYQIHAIFPPSTLSPKQNSWYNCIFFDSVTTFYNCPLVSYFHISLFTKLCFLPNQYSYTIENLEKYTSFYDTLFSFAKQFSKTSFSRFCIYPYAFFFRDPLFRGSFSDYSSLNDYFTRNITHQAYVNKDTKVVSPCCGIVMESGDISSNTLFQTIKNEKIKLCTQSFSKYINIFLRPHDYHCFHAPISGKIVDIEYFQGTRDMLSTNNTVVIHSSLIKNTKIALRIQNDKEEMLLIAIGGFFIGSIQLFVQKDSIVQHGDKIGCFDFGSSILLLHNNQQYHVKNGYVKVFDALYP